MDIVFAHNVMTQHFNMPLLSALHRQLDQGRYDTSWFGVMIFHAMSIRSPACPAFGFPWDLLVLSVGRNLRSGFSTAPLSVY